MSHNIVNAIIHLINNPITDLQADYIGRNRANSMGDALERYVQDLFIGGFALSETERLQAISEHFSYLGNASNPPDAMLRDGDALEVKKIESRNSDLAFNSSYPKAKLHVDHPMLTVSCRSAEMWQQKDMLYAVGTVEQNRLKALAFVYGEDYFASDKSYNQIQDLVLTDKQHIVTAELKFNWRAKNPFKVFDYIHQSNANANFEFMAVINDEKWHQLNNINELEATIKNHSNAQLQKVKIQNPNIENDYKAAYLVTFFVE